MVLIQQYLTETWALIAEMGPYLLLGFLVAGLLHHWFRQQWIEQRLGSPGWRSTAFASLVGVPMPLCSCGVIPVTAGLREKGASKVAATSFLTSTPQTGVDSILATYGMLGPLFAIYRVFIAFLSGFVIGVTVEKLGSKDDHLKKHAEREDEDRIPTWKQSAKYGFLTLPGDIAGSLTIGFLLAGMISTLAPDNLLANLPGGVYSSVLLTTLIATPFYICPTGSIPLALVLIAMLAFGYRKMSPSGELMPEGEGPEHLESELATLTIQRMSCSHCRDSAVEGLTSLPFASRVDVDINSDVVSRKLEYLGFTAKGFILKQQDHEGQ